MTDISDIDDQIAAATGSASSDDLAALYVKRGEILGHPVTVNHLAYRLGVDEAEAQQVWDRLAESGVVEAAPPTDEAA